MTGRNDEASAAATLPKCRNCDRELAAPEVGWECECGIVVCAEPACFDEYFKVVAGGEATRCRTCGLVT